MPELMAPPSLKSAAKAKSAAAIDTEGSPVPSPDYDAPSPQGEDDLELKLPGEDDGEPGTPGTAEYWNLDCIWSWPFFDVVDKISKLILLCKVSTYVIEPQSRL